MFQTTRYKNKTINPEGKQNGRIKADGTPYSQLDKMEAHEQMFCKGEYCLLCAQ